MIEDIRASGWEATLAEWAPRVIGAVLILLAAWFIGKLVKGALAKGVDKAPWLAHHNEGRDKKSTAGARIGDVAYWLILLFGVVAALNVLQLGAVVTPLNTMLQDFFAFIPNIVGAALIFFIGFIVATLAKRLVTAALQAMNLDRWLQKAGLSSATGASGLASAIGTLVMVLILIPVTIQALETLGIEAISNPAIAVLSTILAAIPNVLAAAIVLAIGWAIGRWIAGVVERVLPATGFDKSVSSLMGGAVKGSGASQPSAAARSSMASDGPPPAYATGGMSDASADPMAKTASSGTTPSKVVANIVLFAVVAFSAIEAARLLEFAAIAAIVQDILGLAGRVIVGGAIIAAGVLLAQVLSNALDKGTAGKDGFASNIVKWATIALATAMGLRFMGIADEIVILAFGLILGSAAVAAALAFGLGGRQAAGRFLERAADQAEQKMRQRQVQPQPNQAQPGLSEPRSFGGDPTTGPGSTYPAE